jgi:hypothetical protein
VLVGLGSDLGRSSCLTCEEEAVLAAILGEDADASVGWWRKASRTRPRVAVRVTGAGSEGLLVMLLLEGLGRASSSTLPGRSERTGRRLRAGGEGERLMRPDQPEWGWAAGFFSLGGSASEGLDQVAGLLGTVWQGFLGLGDGERSAISSKNFCPGLGLALRFPFRRPALWARSYALPTTTKVGRDVKLLGQGHEELVELLLVVVEAVVVEVGV